MMDIKHIADKLGVTVPTVRKYVRHGMPVKETGPHNVLDFNAADCLRWVKEHLPRKK
jgi:phage terminase Nu1 subunit (DNA packaging protein)